MSLHLERVGRGRPLVLLHGWGFHSGVWSGLAQDLARGHEVHLVDLPGHGHSRGHEFPALDDLVDDIAHGISADAIVVGWSMGALIAQRLAHRHPAKVRSLALIAGTPCFVARDGWPHAMAPATFEAFADELRNDAPEALARFARLNAFGAGSARGAMRALKNRMSERPGPSASALDGGLDLLRGTDLRADAPSVAKRSLVIHGSHDRIVPIAAGRWLAHALPNAELLELPGAAHLPFVTDRGAVARALESLDG